jgi:hypothetical protein
MAGLLADINVKGHFDLVLGVFAEDCWRKIWASLSLTIQTFRSLGLPFNASDVVVWQTCQQHQLVLVTGNRNRRGPESLEEAIATLNTPQSLPVFTFANPPRILNSRVYAARVAESMLEYLIDLDRWRGTGRLYLP